MKYLDDKIAIEFISWLKSPQNPNYNGQKYDNYDYYLDRLIEKAIELKLIDKTKILITDINWLNNFYKIYESNLSLQDEDKMIGTYGGRASLKKFIIFINYKNTSKVQSSINYEELFKLYLEDCATESGKQKSTFLGYKSAIVRWWERDAKQFSSKQNLFDYVSDIEFNYFSEQYWKGGDPDAKQGIKLYISFLSEMKFKKLLGWFVNQIKINNDIIGGDKKSGQGYAGGKIRDLYSEWRTYIDFELDCSLRCDYAKAFTNSNYIHLSNGKVNVQPVFVKVGDKSDVTALNIVIKDSNNEVINYIFESSIKELGLFDGSYPNKVFRTFFADYKNAIMALKKGNDVVTSNGNGVKTEMETKNRIDNELNLILYGPPGTGKTYNTVKRAVEIIEQENFIDNGYDNIKARYDNYISKEQIAFATFHQSYGYEEFIEGIKPVIDEGGVKYEVLPGVFKKFCDKAKKLKNDITQYGTDESSTVWKVSLGRAEDKDIRKDCFDRGRIRLGWGNEQEIIDDEVGYDGEGKSIVNAFVFEMKKGDIVLSRSSTTTIDAIGVILEDECRWDKDYKRYNRYRNVKWLLKGINKDIKQINNNKIMVQGAVYKLNVTVDNVLAMLQENKNRVSADDYDFSQPYVFIIDEINRGNVSKIFGELITLIEPTKRLGAEEEMKCTLPYSGVPFGVPKNVYILGTMNTADRSLVQLDAALRRRFDFEEMMPDYNVIKEKVGEVAGIDVAKLLETINNRVTCLLDREHQIGHSYFLKLKENKSVSKLAEIFKKNIIPLLQEYFFDDYEAIKNILNGVFIKEENNTFNNGRRIFSINLTEVPADYIKIYYSGASDSNDNG